MAIIIELQSISEYDFYWVHANPANIDYVFDNSIKRLEIKAKVTKDEETSEIIVSPDEFFIIDSVIYLSALFNDGDSLVEKMFKQEKGKKPVEVESLPGIPDETYYEGNDGRYSLIKNQYQERFVSDIKNLTTGLWMRNGMISNYLFGTFFEKEGCFLDIKEGVPQIRLPGLYFWRADRKTMDRISVNDGRMWRL